MNFALNSRKVLESIYPVVFLSWLQGFVHIEETWGTTVMSESQLPSMGEIGGQDEIKEAMSIHFFTGPIP
jgi:hypothetical protein